MKVPQLSRISASEAPDVYYRLPTRRTAGQSLRITRKAWRRTNWPSPKPPLRFSGSLRRVLGLHGEPLPECRKCGFDLIDARVIAEIKETVHRRLGNA
jgi:hypothetical protein